VDGALSSVVYVQQASSLQDLPPILVVVQKKIEQEFTSKVIKLCLSLFKDHKALPILLIIALDGFSSETVKSRFCLQDYTFLQQAYCKFWAKDCFIMSADTIEPYVNA
jgi:hypothetical protein